MNIKRNATDKYFSDFIRERARWKCERCGKDMSNERQSLHASHFIGRGNKSVRWNIHNAAALCGGVAPWGLWGCHKYFSENPAEHYLFFEKRLGKEKLEELIITSRKTMKELGMDEREIRKELKLYVKSMKRKVIGAR